MKNDYFLFYSFFYILLILQTAYISYKIFLQCNYDIKFLDWETPIYHDEQGEVSMWRSIFIAKEWNKLQTQRKTCIEFTLVCMSFLLMGLDLNKNALHQSNLDKSSAYSSINIALRFANTTWWWIFVSTIQWVWKFLLLERYFSEPPSQLFIDQCTVANISIFILDEKYHGYYLHGSSPYEFADCSMMTMLEQMEKEENGFMVKRGMDSGGAPQNCQSFEIFVTHDFNQTLEKVLL